MNIDLNYKFKELDGKVICPPEPVLDDDGNQKKDERGVPLFKKGKDFTLRTVCRNVLLNPPVDIDQRTGKPKEIPGEDKQDWYELAKAINQSDGLYDFSAEEITLLKDFINKKYPSPLIVGQARQVLDPTGSDRKKTKKKAS